MREANDLTNELLTSNAKNLRDSNKAIRTEMERGVFDIEAVKAANADLIGTIQESLQIADEGKARRAACLCNQGGFDTRPAKQVFLLGPPSHTKHGPEEAA